MENFNCVEFEDRFNLITKHFRLNIYRTLYKFNKQLTTEFNNYKNYQIEESKRNKFRITKKYYSTPNLTEISKYDLLNFRFEDISVYTLTRDFNYELHKDLDNPNFNKEVYDHFALETPLFSSTNPFRDSLDSLPDSEGNSTYSDTSDILSNTIKKLEDLEGFQKSIQDSSV